MGEFPKNLFLIWSYQHTAWWRPGSRGYTWDIAKAGLYEKAEAEGIVENARGEEAMLPARPTLEAFVGDQERIRNEAIDRRNDIRCLVLYPEKSMPTLGES